jgi:CheY-like chemotaxis protein
VLTAMMMPLLDGPGLIAALREAAAVADGRRMPPIMVLTAGGMAEARAIRADVVLRKPFDLDVLERHIARLLTREAG